MISSEGIQVNPQKIDAVKNGPRPTSPLDIQSFLGLVGYYRRFVEGFFLSITAPLTILNQKQVKFQWSDSCEKILQELKAKLTSAPVLILSEGSNGFVIYCNASRVGIGYVLIQNGKLIPYASR